MLSLLALLSAGTAPAAGFAGGALVGAQVGYSYINLKRLAKDKAITKEVADKQVKLFADALTAVYTPKTMGAGTDEKDFTDRKVLDGKAFTIKADLKGLDPAKADDVKKAAEKVVDAYNAAVKSEDFAKAETVTVWFLQDAGKDFAAKNLNTQDVVKAVAKEDACKALSKTLVNNEAEGKYTSNNGFIGGHLGYLGRVNDKVMLGGLVEGNWVFGKDLKLDLDDKEVKDTSARFNVNAYLRAMFNLTEKFMVGADLGVSMQEIRQLKDTSKTDKESKWFWGPAARLVLGVALTDNILATAHFGGVFPIKQDHLNKDFKAKYTNFTGGVGISYAFGA